MNRWVRRPSLCLNQWLRVSSIRQLDALGGSEETPVPRYTVTSPPSVLPSLVSCNLHYLVTFSLRSGIEVFWGRNIF